MVLEIEPWALCMLGKYSTTAYIPTAFLILRQGLTKLPGMALNSLQGPTGLVFVDPLDSAPPPPVADIIGCATRFARALFLGILTTPVVKAQSS